MWTKLKLGDSTEKRSVTEKVALAALKKTLYKSVPAGEIRFLAGGSANLTFLKSSSLGDSVVRVFGTGQVAIEEASVENRILSSCFSDLSNQYLYLSEFGIATIEMSRLSSASPGPVEILNLQKKYQSAIMRDLSVFSCGRARDIDELRESAERIVRGPFASNHLADETKVKCIEHIVILKNLFCTVGRVPCHGDLGPKNILTDSNNSLVAIDWEDRFWGIAGYDYLYWLTFLRNEKHLNTHNLKLSGLRFEVCKAVLLMIVLNKEYFALTQRNVSINRQSVQSRIEKILSLEDRQN